ncbi:MAG: 3-hydroxy-9,10-secoandrosta-1,3,5(10)-triene-9,17-dione monooxygenase [Myxococcota bacterium]|jgi:3-hydroxy-9,10-secoandrosta-1,3,5(10)-triene-9,17-dione monooxygenase
MTQITPEEIVRRANDIAPTLRARASATNAARRLSAETIADFKEAGFFRILQPARYGGFEMDPRVFFTVQTIIAAACPSTAWCLGVIAVHAWQLALFPEAAQEAVWGEDTSVLISSSYMPVGKVTPVEGGYRLSGKWGFSSGSDHCQWAFLGAFVPAGEGKPPDMRTFLVPRKDYELLDTWHVSGLRGTGSNDVVVKDAFIPEAHTHRFADGFLCQSPGNAINTAPLFRVPFGQIFVRSVSTAAIGMAQGALTAYEDICKAKISRASGKKSKESPSAQQAAAAASAKIRTTWMVLEHNFDQMMAAARAGEKISIADRVQYRYDSAVAASDCAAVIRSLFANAGSGAIFLDSPLQVYFQDVHAAAGHYANNLESPGNNLGRVRFGQRSTDYFI